MISKRDIALMVAGAGLIGTAIGVVSTPAGRDTLATATDMRGRPPQPGDYWGGCNDARAAGTAPIYRGEPGYRADMDGDEDGIACEPYY